MKEAKKKNTDLHYNIFSRRYIQLRMNGRKLEPNIAMDVFPLDIHIINK